MSDTAQTALGNPNTFHEYDDDGTAHDPMVVWDLSIGCTATVGFQGDHLVVLVSTSDQDKRAGITRRAVTRQQVADYACQLLTLVGDSLPMAGAEHTKHDIKRVARALMRVQHSGCLVWEEESDELRGHLMDQARAAIAALKGGGDA
ncbi:hypothetical protein [Saccharopolyspora tripterygii]